MPFDIHVCDPSWWRNLVILPLFPSNKKMEWLTIWILSYIQNLVSRIILIIIPLFLLLKRWLCFSIWLLIIFICSHTRLICLTFWNFILVGFIFNDFIVIICSTFLRTCHRYHLRLFHWNIIIRRHLLLLDVELILFLNFRTWITIWMSYFLLFCCSKFLLHILFWWGQRLTKFLFLDIFFGLNWILSFIIRRIFLLMRWFIFLGS